MSKNRGRPALLLRWSGNGELSDLRRTVKNVLRVRGENAKVSEIGRSIVLRGIRSAEAAWRLRFLPGVSWIAIGNSTNPDPRGVATAVESVAKSYLRKRTSFRVQAEMTESGVSESDFIGAASSRLLEEFRGTRVDERRPKFVFRVAVDRSSAVAGIQVLAGVGGAPTSPEKTCCCLVSGGAHSSVLAWMAARAGHSLLLLHAYHGAEGMREVARLYAELSHRMDPTALSLEVVFANGSSDAGSLLRAWLRDNLTTPVFCGAHSECRDATFFESTRVKAPLYFYPEEEFLRVLDSLGLHGVQGQLSPLSNARGVRFNVKRFGGVLADASRVLDTLFN